jgi:hypothetical protein
MTNLLPYSTIQNTAGEGAGAPGDAPTPGTAGTLMTGNPQSSQYTPNGNYQPQNQNAVQQLTGTQISAGNINTNSVPTNALTAPGTDSLMAQMSRGQVIMADSTYGQSGFIPQNGGASPQVPSPAANLSQSVTARVANVLTYPAPGATSFTGN